MKKDNIVIKPRLSRLNLGNKEYLKIIRNNLEEIKYREEFSPSGISEMVEEIESNLESYKNGVEKEAGRIIGNATESLEDKLKEQEEKHKIEVERLKETISNLQYKEKVERIMPPEPCYDCGDMDDRDELVEQLRDEITFLRNWVRDRD